MTILHNLPRWNRLALVSVALTAFAPNPVSSAPLPPPAPPPGDAAAGPEHHDSPMGQLGVAALSLYKTMTYTSVVLTTDQLWYWGAAAAA
jgi:hypothetical protein